MNLKRFLSLMLAFAMVLSYVPQTAFAAEGEAAECLHENMNVETVAATCTDAGFTTYIPRVAFIR